MILRIHGRNQSKIINLDKSFFKNKSRDTLSPVEKAESIARDTMGRGLEGFVLEYDGEVIVDTMSNNERTKPLNKILKFQ